MITFSNVTYTVQNKIILDNISFEIKKGDFVAVLGPNGAGKSTLLQLILGIIKPTSGTITVYKEKPGMRNDAIGYSPQSKPFDIDLPILGKDYVALGLNGKEFGFHTPKKDTQRKVQAILEEFDAKELGMKKLGKLSGGEQQRLSLALAMISEPDIVLLDEPLANLDLSYQAEIVRRIYTYHKEHNHTILLVAHDVNPLLSYIDTVLYIANAHVKMGAPEEVIQDAVLTELYQTPVTVFHVNGRIFVAESSGIIH
jgi:zinc/manganese transport system ATP-binding protein